MNCRKRRTGGKDRKKVKKKEKHQIDKAKIDAARYGHYLMIFCHDAEHIKKADNGSAANTAAQRDSFCRLLFKTAVCQKKVNKRNNGEKRSIQEFFHNAGSSLTFYLYFGPACGQMILPITIAWMDRFVKRKAISWGNFRQKQGENMRLVPNLCVSYKVY